MKKRIPLLISIGFLGSVLVVGSSLAWLTRSAAINGPDGGKLPIESGTESGYFAYGNGLTKNTAYGIKTPRQLYNLAWLQYLGLLDLDSKQLYFELADNIDMTGWVLPPIGTETYPFISYFDGQGYVISNLTVSNNFSEYNTHPSVISAWDNSETSKKKQPHILGLFGVVGNYNSLPAASYSSAANKVENTAIYNATIKTTVKDSLMGVAVGYNSGDLSNLVIDSSSIDIDSSLSGTTSYGDYTSNISDFTLVGYTTKKDTVRKASQTTYGVNVDSNISFNATEDGSSNGWGGSIDMKSVLERLQLIRRNYTTGSRFEYKRTYGIHSGVKDTNYTATTSTANRTYAYANDTAHKEWGHFHIMGDSDSDLNNYSLLGGGHLEIDNYFEENEHNGYKITDGTNYLNLNRGSTSFENGTVESSATIWNFNIGSGTSTISYRYNNLNNTTNNYTNYYLYNNNGTLQVSTYNSTNWTITSVDENNITIKSGNYYLIYFDGAWTLYDPSQTTTDYYLIYDNNGHYLNEGTSYNATVGNSRDTATKWYRGTSRNGDPLYYCGTDKYLGYYSGSYPVQAYNDSRAFYTLTSGAASGTGTMSCTYDGSTYYIRFNNNSWTSGNQGQAATMTIELVHVEPPSNYNLSKTTYLETSGPDEYFDHSVNYMDYSGNDVTYFPLTTVNNTNNFDPAENNTAYVVAGSSITTSTNSYSASLSNVRFASYYTISGNIDTDYNSSTGKFTHIYTIDDSLQKTEITNNMDDYERLKDSSTALGEIMKGGTQTYGLHFMESTISMDAITTATYVKMNNVEHTNYELPVNSIDFHLKEFGYINFIAGSYFNRTTAPVARNDSFFALYQIERLDSSPNKINRILEVLGVYQHSSKAKNYSYVYQLTDGTNTFYTKPYKVTNSEGGREWLYDTETEYSNNQYVQTLPSNYSKVFDTKRIKKNNLSANDFNKHVYYFEIPMNDGEFCLGSVSGGVGSYLMYLDIGANAAKTERTIFYEKFTLEEKTYVCPIGVSLSSLSSSYASGVTAINVSQSIDFTDSVCVAIKASYIGSLKIDRNGNDVALTRANAANAPPVYSGNKIMLLHDLGSSTPLVPNPLTWMKYETTRMQFYDYMINSDTLVVTSFTDLTTTNMINSQTSSNRTIMQSKYSGHLVDSTKLVVAYTYDTAQGLDQRDSMKVYRSDTGVRYTSAEIASSSSLPIPSAKLSSTVILSVTMLLDGVDNYENNVNLVVAVDPNAGTSMYYIFDGYAIEITPSAGKIYVTIISLNSTKTIKIGGATVSGANQEIEIVPATNP